MVWLGMVWYGIIWFFLNPLNVCIAIPAGNPHIHIILTNIEPQQSSPHTLTLIDIRAADDAA